MRISSSSSTGKVLVVDSTLRDGEQAPGIAFSYDEKLALARLLYESGVDEIETPIPSGGEDEFRLNRELNSRKIPALTFCRARREDIDAAEACGARRVHISFPVSDRMLKIFGMNHGWLLDTIGETGRLCSDRFEFFSAGMLDASRAGMQRCLGFSEAAREAGFMRIRYADTLGIQFPGEVAKVFASLSFVGLPLEYHGHNDFGLALANGLAAVEGGAAAVSATVLGIGERAGNLALEEFATALHFSGKGRTGIQLDKLIPLCRKTAEFSHREIPSDKPIAGSAVFQHESGIHTAALIRDESILQPFSPELVGGGGSTLVFGATSGSHALEEAFTSLGIEAGHEDILGFLVWLRSKARQEKRSYSVNDLEHLYGDYKQQK